MANKQNPFSKEVIKQKRRFPTSKTVALFIMLAIQIAAILLVVLYDPKPQDRIDHYEIIAEPNSDGTLDIEYNFVWTPLDENEDLTWVEIGMPNPSFGFYPESFSSNIKSYEKYSYEEYVSVRLDLDRPYKSGETLIFSFRVRQAEMLCVDAGGYFYELIPGWFNATPIEHYTFVWKGDPATTNAPGQKYGYPAWEGEMEPGTYVTMQAYYPLSAFSNVPTVDYKPFNDEYVENSLTSDKMFTVGFSLIVFFLLVIAEVYMVDCVISYYCGRGFLSGSGHYIHLYGGTNPQYTRYVQTNNNTHHGGHHSGGGCACACACACAGGGRAGCSQKDTHAFKIEKYKGLKKL